MYWPLNSNSFECESHIRTNIYNAILLSSKVKCRLQRRQIIKAKSLSLQLDYIAKQYFFNYTFTPIIIHQTLISIYDLTKM